MTNTRESFGRRVITTDKEYIDSSNVVEVLDKMFQTHVLNNADICYLYNYYKGKQPILEREKSIRPEINNKIVENRANEIVSFKVGYLMGEPIQYVNRNGDETVSEEINLLNEYVFEEDKESSDKEIAEWFYICGTAFRMVLPSRDDEGSPFKVYTLDPRYTFVVYNSGLGNRPMMGVKYIVRDKGVLPSSVVFSVYTDREYFEIENSTIIKHEYHTLGAVPIIEYPANSARLGAFEIVLPLLDGINTVASNRLDGVEQFVESLLMFKGVDIESEDFKNLRELGGIKVPTDGDVKYLVQELNQTQTQTLVDSMYQTVLTICGMPSIGNGQTSDSSNNGAVILRNGWQSAEARAKDAELSFKRSEKKFLKLALRIADTLKGMSLKLSDIEIRFTRRNYENISEKATVLTTLLGSDKVHPRLAFEHSGLFVDPEVAYQMSMEYMKERENELTEQLVEESMSEIPPEDGEAE